MANPETFPVLESTRLRLRQILPTDAPQLFDLYDEPEVAKYLDIEPLSSLEEAQELVEAYRQGFVQGHNLYWAITQQSSEELIGTVGFFFLPDGESAELDFELLPYHWNQGIISEALALALEFARESLGLTHIEAYVVKENPASIRVLEKLGFSLEARLEGEFDTEAGRLDALMYVKR
ncbi:MAG: GNAT family N-acetyltransferase [Meiothermus sp.]|nr:GNAT family N-acetyltransferase [Meiothermus sp.]